MPLKSLCLNYIYTQSSNVDDFVGQSVNTLSIIYS